VSTFGAILWREILDHDMSQSLFAKEVGHPVSFVNLIIHGHRTPPLERIEQWADLLKLSGQPRDRFLAMAAIAHLPDKIRVEFENLYDDHIQLREEYAELFAKYRSLNRAADGE
jgi:hypothetical protein